MMAKLILKLTLLGTILAYILTSTSLAQSFFNFGNSNPPPAAPAVSNNPSSEQFISNVKSANQREIDRLSNQVKQQIPPPPPPSTMNAKTNPVLPPITPTPITAPTTVTGPTADSNPFASEAPGPTHTVPSTYSGFGNTPQPPTKSSQPPASSSSGSNSGSGSGWNIKY
jgi:hypothetical protein